MEMDVKNKRHAAGDMWRKTDLRRGLAMLVCESLHVELHYA